MYEGLLCSSIIANKLFIDVFIDIVFFKDQISTVHKILSSNFVNLKSYNLMEVADF